MLTVETVPSSAAGCACRAARNPSDHLIASNITVCTFWMSHASVLCAAPGEAITRISRCFAMDTNIAASAPDHETRKNLVSFVLASMRRAEANVVFAP